MKLLNFKLNVLYSNKVILNKIRSNLTVDEATSTRLTKQLGDNSDAFRIFIAHEDLYLNCLIFDVVKFKSIILDI